MYGNVKTNGLSSKAVVNLHVHKSSVIDCITTGWTDIPMVLYVKSGRREKVTTEPWIFQIHDGPRVPLTFLPNFPWKVFFGNRFYIRKDVLFRSYGHFEFGGNRHDGSVLLLYSFYDVASKRQSSKTRSKLKFYREKAIGA